VDFSNSKPQVPKPEVCNLKPGTWNLEPGNGYFPQLRNPFYSTVTLFRK
jgi:hypothetical protein